MHHISNNLAYARKLTITGFLVLVIGTKMQFAYRDNGTDQVALPVDIKFSDRELSSAMIRRIALNLNLLELTSTGSTTFGTLSNVYCNKEGIAELNKCQSDEKKDN